jgi:hypothetical protein
MNARTEKILRQALTLPLTEVRELVANLKVAEEWVFYDEGNTRCAADKAMRGELRTVIPYADPPAKLFRAEAKTWRVVVMDKEVGTTPTPREARDMAESELELNHYVIPWKRVEGAV